MRTRTIKKVYDGEITIRVTNTNKKRRTTDTFATSYKKGKVNVEIEYLDLSTGRTVVSLFNKKDDITTVFFDMNKDADDNLFVTAKTISKIKGRPHASLGSILESLGIRADESAPDYWMHRLRLINSKRKTQDELKRRVQDTIVNPTKIQTIFNTIALVRYIQLEYNGHTSDVHLHRFSYPDNLLDILASIIDIRGEYRDL
jgi:hypothetical protein